MSVARASWPQKTYVHGYLLPQVSAERWGPYLAHAWREVPRPQTPAQAGIYGMSFTASARGDFGPWVPAFAGTFGEGSPGGGRAQWLSLR